MKVFDSKQSRIAANLILIVSLISYLPALSCGINIWYDNYLIIDNSVISSLSSHNIRLMFTEYYAGSYQPLAILSYAIEYSLFDLSPLPSHLDNLIIHLINVLLVFVFTFRMFSKLHLAVITSLLFGIHPLHVESVTYLSARSDLLFSLFYMLGLIAYLKFKESGRNKDYLYTLVLFILSCLSNWLAFTFPLIILTIDYFLDKRLKYKILLNKIPFLVISFIFSLIAFNAQVNDTIPVIAPDVNYSLSEKLLLVNYSICSFIEKLFIPSAISGINYHQLNAAGSISFVYYMAAFITALFLFLLIYSLRYTRRIFFAGLFFLISIIPPLVAWNNNVTLASERYFYLPSLGLFILIAFGAGFLYTRSLHSIVKKLLLFFAVIIVMIWCFLTFERTKDWKDPEVFWSGIVEKYPDKEYSYYMRGQFYFNQENNDAAIIDFNRCIEILPNSQQALIARSKIFENNQQYNKALSDLEKVIQFNPGNFYAQYTTGEIYGKYINDTDKSLYHLLIANKLEPGNFSVVDGLGIIYAIKGNYSESLRYQLEALEIEPKSTNTIKNIILLNEALGDFQKAEKYKNYLEQVTK